MASTGGGKIRSKRSKVTNKPYARRTSLLGRVTETVRDFITPSWLSNAWHGVPEEEEVDVAPPGSTNEGSMLPGYPAQARGGNLARSGILARVDLEEGAPEQAENPEDDNDGDEPDIIMEEQQQPSADVILEDQPSTSTGHRSHKTPFNRYAKPLSASTPNDDIQIIAEKKPSDRDDGASDTSVSTSGCSSLIPNVDMADHRAKLSKYNLDRLTEMTRNPSDPRRFRSDSPRLRSDSPRLRSEAPLDTSLWSEMSSSGRSSPFGRRPSRPQQSAQSSRRPTFNSSYFCTPRGGSSFESTMTDSPGRASPFSSPFYPGKTTFGGSSAQKPAKRPRTSPYEVHLPVKRHVRIRPSSRNEVDVTSQTAKRILETLEKMSTPLSDAKKIPLSPTSSPFSFTPGRSSRLRQTGVPHAPGVQERVRMPGPPTTGIRIPQRARIADNRQPPLLPVSKREPKIEAKPETVSRPPEDTSPRLTSSPPSAGFSFKMTPSTSTTAPARTHESRLPSIGGESGKSGGKMRSSKREQHYKSPIKDEDDVLEVPDLPDVPLPLANGKTLPTFQFGGPPPAASGSLFKGRASTTSQPIKPLMASTPSPFGTTSAGTGGSFKFSSPIVKDDAKSSGDSAPAPKSFFKFSAPKQAGTPDAKSTPSGFGGSQSKATPSFGASAGPSKLSKKSPIKIQEEDPEEATGGFMVAKQLKTGSCLEVLGMLSKPNRDSTDKPTSSSSGSTSGATKPLSLAEQFKPAAGSWSCDQCMVSNEANTDKCVSCTAAKPGGSAAANAAPSRSKPLFGHGSVGKLPASKTPVVNCGFGDKFKKPAGSWTCDACLVPNEGNVTKCVSCQTPKPGAVNSSSAVAKAPPSSTPIGFGDKFKPEAGSWKCDTCMCSNKSTVSRCVACETPKPGSDQSLSAPPASVYKFGNSSTTPASGAFKFGAPTTANQSSGGSITSGEPLGGSITSGTVGFKFGAPSATVSSESKLNANAAPFKFGQSTDDSAKSSAAPTAGGFQFANPSSSSSSSGGFKMGGSLTNDKDGGGAPPNADPFKSGAFNAPKTTKPVASFATATRTTTDSVASAAKETSAPSNPQFNFGAAAPGTKTDSALSTNFSTGGGTTEQKTTFNFGGPKTDEKQSTAATTNPAFKFGGTATSTEQKDTTSNKPAFNFGGAESSASSDATKSIFSGASQPSSQANAVSEQSGGKPLFNFKSNATNTSFQFGSGGSGGSNAAAEQKPAQENKAAFNFTATTATTGDNKSSFNFGAGSKTAENKDAGSSNSLTKPGTYVFGGNTSSSNPTSNTTPAASITPFKFGDTSAQNSGAFVFGGTPAASANSQPTPASSSGGGFSFTASAPATTQQATPAFGASSTTTNSVFGGFGSNASSANPSPVFGNPAPTTTSTAIPNFGTTASTPFGSQNQQQGAAAPAFGAANSGTPFGGSPAPTFGAGSAPAFGAGTAAPAFGNNATTTPAFGNANATQQNAAFQPNATAAFQFGGNNTQSTQQNSSVFKFGASQNNNSAAQNSNSSVGNASQGFNFSAQQAPSFNFGASAASTPSASASPYQFNASGSNAASNPFNPMPTSSSTHSGRKIKRAVRRNMRK